MGFSRSMKSSDSIYMQISNRRTYLSVPLLRIDGLSEVTQLQLLLKSNVPFAATGKELF